MLNLGILFLFGLLIAVVMLCYEHWLLRDADLAKLDAAFFTMNGYISVALFVFTLSDILSRHGTA